MTGVNIKAIGNADIATASNGSYHVTIPIKITRRGRRKAVTLPDGTAFTRMGQRPHTHPAGVGPGASVAGTAGVRQGKEPVRGCRAGRDGPGLRQPDGESHHPGTGHRGRHPGRGIAEPRHIVRSRVRHAIAVG